MKIRKEKFTIRNLEPEEDKLDYIKNINNEDVLRYMGSSYPFTEEKYDKLVDHMRENANDSFDFVIEIDDEVVGSVGLNIQNKKMSKHVGEIDYWISNKHAGKGIVSEAIKIIIVYAFHELVLLKVISKIFTKNIASARVLEKNGFELEGVLKKQGFKNNEYYDIGYYSKFKDLF